MNYWQKLVIAILVILIIGIAIYPRLQKGVNSSPENDDEPAEPICGNGILEQGEQCDRDPQHCVQTLGQSAYGYTYSCSINCLCSSKPGGCSCPDRNGQIIPSIPFSPAAGTFLLVTAQIYRVDNNCAGVQNENACLSIKDGCKYYGRMISPGTGYPYGTTYFTYSNGVTSIQPVLVTSCKWS